MKARGSMRERLQVKDSNTFLNETKNILFCLCQMWSRKYYEICH